MRRILPLLALWACDQDTWEDPSVLPVAPYDPTTLVDPFIATGGIGGETASVSPGASMPFGLVLVGPDTRTVAYGPLSAYHCAGYHYDDDAITAISMTHAHGMGVVDYGGVPWLARASWDDGYTDKKTRMATFSHDSEDAGPGWYTVELTDDGTLVEIAATERGAVVRLTFDEGASAPTFVWDLGHSLPTVAITDAWLDIDPETGATEGYHLVDGSYSGRFGGVQTHFVATFDTPPESVGAWSSADSPELGATTASGTGVEEGELETGGWLSWPAGTTQVTARIAVSYTDTDGAWANHAAEVEDVDYVEAKRRALAAWREQLGTVRVRGGTEADRTIFHSALYRSALMPSLQHDVDYAYRGTDQEVHTADGPHYSDFSLWDTFRTVHSWYLWWDPERQVEMAQALVRMADDGGHLPKWPLAHGYTGGMISTPTDQVLAETWLKGHTTGWDVEGAFAYSVAHATGEVTTRGGISTYLDKGYVSFEAAGGPASRTLEFAWADHALSLWAEGLGEDTIAAELSAQSGNWRNTWDEDQGYFVGRYDDGSFHELTDEFTWQDDYTEGNAWHYKWFVPYDVPAMIELQYDGDTSGFLDEATMFWDEVADEEDDLLPDDYYWHGNEPVMHYAWLPAIAGDGDLTAEASRWVRENRYFDSPEKGLDGNDDAGTLSAWYLWSALGVYPIAGTPDYVVGSPLFERVEIDRPDGSTWVIRSPGTGTYVEAATLGDQALTQPVFTHDAWLEAGGQLVLERGETGGLW